MNTKLLPKIITELVELWKQRHSVSKEKYSELQLEFSPEIIRMQHGKIPPFPRVIVFLVAALVCTALAGAFIFSVDTVAVAQGKLVASSKTKIIQPLEPGIISKILVNEGEHVSAGQALVVLDKAVRQAENDKLTKTFHEATQTQKRLTAILQATDNGRQNITLPVDMPSGQAEEFRTIAQAQLQEFNSQMQVMDTDLQKKRSEREVSLQTIKRLQNNLQIEKQREKDYQDLFAKGFISKHGYLEKQQNSMDLDGRIKTEQAHAQELLAQIQEQEKQKQATTATFRRNLIEQNNQVGLQIQQLTSEISKARSLLAQKVLVSPVDGTIQQLSIHTIGGVVTEAQNLMAIVPDNEPLIVEAYVENKDIGFVNGGQIAMVKVATFPYTKYGLVHSQVTTVSTDALQDEKKGLLFLVQAKLQQLHIQVGNKRIPLKPGMAVTLEIKTGSRRIIDYILSPLKQTVSEAFRES